ncbi:MAG: HEAT repeat domain-containing protein [Planctomycetes bacterium]|nr:HEAT repeat domain-containing protein [Planctomycetota bacterium]
MPRATPPILATLALACLCAAQAEAIAWTPSLDAALARARTERRVVMVAIHMPGERANEELLRDHYRDPQLVRLSRNTVNVFCCAATMPGAAGRVPGVSAREQQECERAVRDRILKVPAGQPVAAPQHLFLAPDGTVLTSLVFRVGKGELEWAWVDAIRRVDPTFPWTLGGAAHAPRTLAQGISPRSRARPPEVPTPEEVEDALRELKKSRNGWRRNPEELLVVLRSTDPAALDAVGTALRGMGEPRQVEVLRRIGQTADAPWFEVVQRYAEHRSPKVRAAAIEALGRLGEAKAAPALLAQWPKEDADEVRERLLYALAAIGGPNRSVHALLANVLKREKLATLRRACVLALGELADRVAAQRLLTLALLDSDADVRRATAAAIAVRRDTDLRGTLEAAIQGEKDIATKAYLEAARKALDGGGLEVFADYLKR